MPICQKCKHNLDDEFRYCPFCGEACSSEEPTKKQKSKSRGNGSGSVYKNPNGTYRAVVTLRCYAGEDGKTKYTRRIKSGFKTKRDALAVLPELKSQIAPTKPNILFSELYDEWLELHERKVTKSTMNCYKAAYKYYKSIHYERFAEIKSEHLQKCIDQCKNGKRTKQLMKALGTLLYNYALQKDIALKNYASFIYIDKTETTERIAFTDEQIDLLFKSAKKDDYAKYVLCLIYTGFRLEEFLSLKDTDYDTEQNCFCGGSKTVAGKNRFVTVSPKVQAYVDGLLTKEGYIFSPDGKKLSQKIFRRDYFYPALVTAGIIKADEKEHKLTPHCCRHSFATLMKKVDAPPTDKQKLIGHANFEMTAHYTHTNIADLKRITDAL